MRGSFCEAFRESVLREGSSLQIAQAGCSVSRRGVVQVIYFPDIQHDQDEYVTCINRAMLDVAVYLRIGSPTNCQWEAYQLDDAIHRAAYLTAGLGHGFAVLSEEAALIYLRSSAYAPGQEPRISPFGAKPTIMWSPFQERTFPDRDTTAPIMAEAMQLGHQYQEFPAEDPSCAGL